MVIIHSHTCLQEPDFKEDRIVVREGEDQPKKKSWFSRRTSKIDPKASRPPTVSSVEKKGRPSVSGDDDLPERLEHSKTPTPASPAPDSAATVTSPKQTPPATPRASDVSEAGSDNVPFRAGFDFQAIKEAIADAEGEVGVVHAPVAQTPRGKLDTPSPHEPSGRPESVPPPPVPVKDLDEERSASAAPRPDIFTAHRAVSSPMFGSAFHFGDDESDEADGDISSALGGPSYVTSAYASSSVSASGPSRDLSSTFGRSVSLAGPADTRNNFSDNKLGVSGGSYIDYWGSSVPASSDTWSTGLDIGFSDPYSSSSKSRGRPAEDAPQLRFGGPGGSLWELPTSATSRESEETSTVDAVLRSPFSSPPATATLPADILNPFAMSTSDITSGTVRRQKADEWAPPPLPTKNSKANASSLNVNANPWS